MQLELATERLNLRPLSKSDLDIMIALWTDPEVMGFVVEPLSQEQVAEKLLTSVRRGGGGAIGVWCILERARQEKLGIAILLPVPVEESEINWSLVDPAQMPDCEIQIGYLIKREAWGHGYATEAAARLLRFAFEQTDLPEVAAITDPANLASQKVLHKIGLADEGLRRAYARDRQGFRMTRSQWLAREEQERASQDHET